MVAEASLVAPVVPAALVSELDEVAPVSEVAEVAPVVAPEVEVVTIPIVAVVVGTNRIHPVSPVPL